MKKKLLALAVAGAFCGTAFAQSSVTLSGILDASVQSIKDKNGNRTTGVNDGGWDSSRFSLAGQEDLGNGLGAIFKLESRFNGIDTGTNNNSQAAGSSWSYGSSASNSSAPLWSMSYVGLTGSFGTVTLGRQTSMTDDTYSGNSMSQVQRGSILDGTPWLVDNSIKWHSADFGGVSVRAIYGFGETAGDSSPKSWTGLGVTYSQGPLVIDVGYDSYKANNVLTNTTKDANGNTTDAYNTTYGTLKGLGLVASYDFGVAKAIVNYDNGDYGVNGFNKESNFGVGAVVPLMDNKAWVRLDVGQIRHLNGGSVSGSGGGTSTTPSVAVITASNAKKTTFDIAGAYNLSARTAVYALFTDSKVKDSINDSDNVSTNKFAVGVHHTF